MADKRAIKCIDDQRYIIRQLKDQLLSQQLVIEKMREAAENVRHWHDWGRDNEGMVVSSESVRKLWEVVELQPNLDLLETERKRMREATIEECAKVCEETDDVHEDVFGYSVQCAKAIREMK